MTGKRSSVQGLVPAEVLDLPEKNWPTMWMKPDKVEMKKTTSELLGKSLNNSVVHQSETIDVTPMHTRK